MTSHQDPSLEEGCCLPGDFTVTKIPSGYLIGRALPQLGLGPWWEYVAITRDYESAVQQALRLAREDDVRAWLHRTGDDYELLTPRT